MILSFSWTTPALLAGAKTVTRRDWSPRHAAHFEAGMLVDAWNKSPRTRQGRHVATIRIVRAPYLQSTRALPADQWDAEGFSWLVLNGTEEDAFRARRIWNEWRAGGALYVVEFELVDVTPFVMHGAHKHDARGCVLVPIGVL